MGGAVRRRGRSRGGGWGTRWEPCGLWLWGRGSWGHNGPLSGLLRLLGAEQGPVGRPEQTHALFRLHTVSWDRRPWHGASREGEGRARAQPPAGAAPARGPESPPLSAASTPARPGCFCSHTDPGRSPRLVAVGPVLSGSPQAWPRWTLVATGPGGCPPLALAHLGGSVCALDGQRAGVRLREDAPRGETRPGRLGSQARPGTEAAAGLSPRPAWVSRGGPAAEGL